jgi:hypothetical protein
METTYFKCLGPGRTAAHGGSGTWPPVGEWTKPIRGALVPCERGWHVCSAPQLIEWLSSEVYEVEYDGEIVADTNKFVVRHARLTRQLVWNDTAALLFAADCAEHVLHLYERDYPDDKRPRAAIEATRAYARGEIAVAAWAAARDAAWAAEREWQTARLLDYLYGRVELPEVVTP